MNPFRSSLAALTTAGIAFCLAGAVAAQEVNVYSSRHYDNDTELYQLFTDATGIKVNRIEGTPEEMVARMKAEGVNSPADIYLTVDAGRIWLADKEGLLQGVDSPVLEERIPAHLRHPDGHWFGLSERARLIFYSRERTPNPPQTYEALSDPEYQGKICIRSASNVYNLSLMSAIIEHDGEEGARAWAQGLLSNLAQPPEGGDTDQLKGIASGACDIAVANSYYFARAQAAPVEGLSDKVDAIGWVTPNQETTGTHVNISVAGVAAHAPNLENAVKFLEYMTTDEAQEFFANQNHEFPVVAGVEVGPIAKEYGDFKRDTLNLSILGINQPKAQQIFNEVGFP
ncbi:Fe(3+) ABC transporter substrate-binding protein [Amaricoccus sp.]|uniref:Fe(3+) ABC transporter substrate-binding protein n=1 Tax=Amaricoccus sp. TaxID=1872485 RepID=UPI001B621A70|nr:Fe(3+) ABC transporter substrate-binding protein [Amaricoccus sp.]MBP7003802.1 Fe(3+) ABC transporter substrate-binding protein [Amaricoccus sp.]